MNDQANQIPAGAEPTAVITVRVYPIGVPTKVGILTTSDGPAQLSPAEMIRTLESAAEVLKEQTGQAGSRGRAGTAAESVLRQAAVKVNAARPGVETHTALAVMHALLVMGWKPPASGLGEDGTQRHLAKLRELIPEREAGVPVQLEKFELELLRSACLALEARLAAIVADSAELTVHDLTAPAVRKAEQTARLRAKIVNAYRESGGDS